MISLRETVEYTEIGVLQLLHVMESFDYVNDLLPIATPNESRRRINHSYETSSNADLAVFAKIVTQIWY